MPIRIVFCGTPEFAAPSLRSLLDDPAFAVELVVTQPDKAAGRAQTPTAPQVKALALARGIPVVQPEKIRLLEPKMLLQAPPDFLVVVAYGQLLPQTFLDWPSVAPVNVHASLLPRWRGASPIQHAILAGDTETGVSIQKMVLALDAGPVLAQRPTPVGPRETASSLHDRLSVLGAELLTETLKQPLQPEEQDPSRITTCGLLSREDGVVDPESMTAEEIDRRVRALTPWLGVTCPIGGRTVKLLETDMQPHEESVPLPCSGGSILHLMTVQPPGKKPMSAAAWKRGKR